MNHQVIIFDGVCNLCNGFIQFIIKNDKKNKFKFCSLQSEQGQNIIKQNSKDLKNIDSVLLFTNNQIYNKSTAVLKIAKTLGFPYNIIKITSVIPVKLRDRIYDFIAKNRYRWFGKKTSCWIPTSELKEKFLDY